LAFADKLRNLIPLLRGPLRLPPDLLRGLHPTRNPAASWSRDDDSGIVVITMPRPPLQGWRMALAKLIGEPPGKRIELSDEIGATVWELCDGARTIRDICRTVSAKYKLGDRQTEVSVLEFLNMLRSRRLIGIPQQEQVAIKQVGDSAQGSKTQTKEAGRPSDGLGKIKRVRAKRARRN
jgi:hypothetical protein